MIKHVQYVNGNPSVITEYEWDKGFAANTSVTRRNGDNSQLDRIGMKYNPAGKVTERLIYSRQDIPIEKTTYEYDDKGNLKAENFYLDKDAIQVTNLYEYNGQNKITEVKARPDGSIIYKTFFEYYANNNLVKSGTTDGSGKLKYTKEITYDNKGNILTHTINEISDNLKTTDTYTYDTNSNKTHWTSSMNDLPTFEVEYKYDKQNNLTYTKIADIHANTDPLIKSYTYKYDKKGNWIKKTASVNGSPAFVTTRTINYL